MKAKQTPVQQAVAPQSIKEAAYQFATSGETRRSIASYVLEKCPDILDNMPDEVKVDLLDGLALRAHELWGQDYFIKGDTGMMVKVANSLDKDFLKRETHKNEVVVSVQYARSFSGQEFGRLKTTDPMLHGIVGAMRNKFQKYSSNNIGDIKTEIRRILNDGKTSTRAANKSFVEYITDVFETADKRVKVAKDRGDTAADPVKYRVARDAFWKAYNA